MISGRARRLWGNLREERSGWPGRMSIAKNYSMQILQKIIVNKFCTKLLYTNCANASVTCICHHITLTGLVGNERLSAADVVKGDEDHADQVRSQSNFCSKWMSMADKI